MTLPEDERARALELARSAGPNPIAYIVLLPDDKEPNRASRGFCPRNPSYDQLKSILDPIIGPDALFERVQVFNPMTRRLTDMLVDEEGLLKELPFNMLASDIYRRDADWKHKHKGVIVGPAVLFWEPVV